MPQLSQPSAFSREIDANLTAARIKVLRDRWYEYCDRRRARSNVGPNAILKLKNFARSVGWPKHGWAKTFAAVDPAYKDLTVDEIINRLFATSNRDDLVTYLESVKHMYQVSPRDEALLQRFETVCNAFGIDYSELP
jgi:hypothetical protein